MQLCLQICSALHPVWSAVLCYRGTSYIEDQPRVRSIKTRKPLFSDDFIRYFSSVEYFQKCLFGKSVTPLDAIQTSLFDTRSHTWIIFIRELNYRNTASQQISLLSQLFQLEVAENLATQNCNQGTWQDEGQTAFWWNWRVQPKN
jgi:hypothetical protein